MLDAQFVARRAGRALAAAKAAALIKNHRLDGGKQFRGSHQADRHARAAEDGFDDFAVRIIRDDDAVLDRVAADDAAGGNLQIEDRIVRGGKLVNEFFRGRAAIPDARIAFLENDHATALDAFGSSESTAAVTTLAKPMFVMKRPRLSTCSSGSWPSFHSATRTLPASMSGFDADERHRLGERERGADLLAVFAGLQRRGGGDVFCALLRRAALVNGRQAEIARQAAGGRAGIHPGQFKRDQRQRQIFRPGDKPAVFRVQKRGGDAAFVEVREQAVFSRRPFVRIAAAGGDEPGDRPARHATCGLHEHLQFVTVGEAPHQLADVVPGQRVQPG